MHVARSDFAASMHIAFNFIRFACYHSLVRSLYDYIPSSYHITHSVYYRERRSYGRGYLTLIVAQLSGRVEKSEK